MDGIIKKIKGVFPVNTTKAVYIDGTDKTLHEAINDGTLTGTVASTDANFITDAFLLGNDVVFTKDRATGDITVNWSPNVTLARIIKVCYSNGSSRQISFPDGIIIPNAKYLVWDNTNGFQTVDDIGCPYDTVLIGYNHYGRITGGILKDIWNKYNKYTYEAIFDKEYYINAKEIDKPSGKTMHSMVVIGNELIALECYNGNDFNGTCNVYSLPDLTWKSSFTQQLVGTRADTNYNGKINLRLVCADYNENTECLMLGSGTADGSDADNLEGYIFYDAKNWKNYNEPITFNNTPYTLLDFHTENLFEGEYCAKLIWGEVPDTCYLTTSNLQYCHKLLLGTGTNQLSHGTYNYNESKRYNGTYEIIQTFKQETTEVGNKDIHYYKGHLYYPVKYVKGGYRIYKTGLKHDGSMCHEMMIYDPIDQNGSHAITGSPEGIVIYNNQIICSHATYPKFYIIDL